jgi:ABC-type transporter Mla subunit MlaD
LVEVAGARVGTIEAIHLTRGYKARIELAVDRRFAPFRRNATCTIRPQGLLAEYYIECDPGTPSAPELRASNGGTPTVPVTRTTQPVALTDLFDIWSAPVRDRLSLLIAQLGMGTAGRGQELNAILRRSNPSLAAARKVIGILRDQRAELDSLLVSANRAIAPLAKRPERVSAFVREAARAGANTSAHSRELAESIARLPALLDAAEPSLRQLDSVVRTGTPLVRELRAASPALNRLTADIGPFANQVEPTLKALRPALAQGARTLKRSIPVSRAMREYTHNSRSAAELAGPLFTNLRERGFAESLLSFHYRGAAAAARFDKDSHILPAFSVINECSMAATEPVPGCEATFTKPAAARRTARHRARTRTARPPRQETSHTGSGTPSAPAPGPLPKDPLAPVKDLLDQIVPAPQPLPDNLDSLADYLFG